MKRQQKLYEHVILISTLVGLVWTSPNPAVAAPNNDQIKTLVAGNTEFALDLYASLRTEPGNLFLSPHSISTALAMTYAGASGETQSQMANVLHLPPQNESTHATFAALESAIKSAGDNPLCTLHVANALWGQQSYGFLDDFLALNRKHYGAGFRAVDFVGNPEQARRTINTWVAQQTRQIIKELLRQGEVDSADVLILTNAIYFKGIWAYQFNPEHTRDAEFQISPTESVTVPLMFQTCELPYYADEELDLLELPYDGDRLSMVILLPKRLGGLGETRKLAQPQKSREVARPTHPAQRPRQPAALQTRLPRRSGQDSRGTRNDRCLQFRQGRLFRHDRPARAIHRRGHPSGSCRGQRGGHRSRRGHCRQNEKIGGPPGLRRRPPLPLPDPRQTDRQHPLHGTRRESDRITAAMPARPPPTDHLGDSSSTPCETLPKMASSYHRDTPYQTHRR